MASTEPERLVRVESHKRPEALSAEEEARSSPLEAVHMYNSSQHGARSQVCVSTASVDPPKKKSLEINALVICTNGGFGLLVVVFGGQWWLLVVVINSLSVLSENNM